MSIYLLAAFVIGILGMVIMRQTQSRFMRMIIAIPAMITMGALCVLGMF